MTGQAAQRSAPDYFLVPIEIWRPTFRRRLNRVLGEVERQARLAQAQAQAGTNDDNNRLTHHFKITRRS